MWICSKYGFFSIVKKGQPETWQVRARVENDLKELLSATGLPLKVIPTSAGDYAFRLIADKKAMDQIFAVLADSIDYPNFKNCIASLPKQSPKLDAYHAFWGEMLRIQSRSR